MTRSQTPGDLKNRAEEQGCSNFSKTWTAINRKMKSKMKSKI